MRTLFVTILSLTLLSLPTVLSTGVSPVGPIEDGGFEQPFVPPTLTESLKGTPADECIGIGHQVFYGTETVPGRATGGTATAPDPSKADPADAAANATEDPVWQAAFLSGYGHCVFGQDTGTDIVWLSPVQKANQPPTWSVHSRLPSTEFGYYFDEDPFDREARFPADTNLFYLNMWQSYVSEPGLYTANVDELRFDVEAGTVPTQARVQLALSATPLDKQTPYLAGYLDCVLTFSDLQPDADGTVRVDALEGTLTLDGPDSDCMDAHEVYTSSESTEEEKRSALGRLRIVQINFLRFNYGTEDVVIDNVAMPGTTTFAEELAHGNINAPNPGV